MPGGKEADRGISEIDFGMERKLVFDSLSWQTGSHKPGGGLRKDYFAVVPDVVAVGVRNERGLLLIPRIQPKI